MPSQHFRAPANATRRHNSTGWAVSWLSCGASNTRRNPAFGKQGGAGAIGRVTTRRCGADSCSCSADADGPERPSQCAFHIPPASGHYRNIITTYLPWARTPPGPALVRHTPLSLASSLWLCSLVTSGGSMRRLPPVATAVWVSLCHAGYEGKSCWAGSCACGDFCPIRSPTGTQSTLPSSLRSESPASVLVAARSELFFFFFFFRRRFRFSRAWPPRTTAWESNESRAQSVATQTTIIAAQPSCMWQPCKQ